VYPLINPGDPLEMIGVGTFAKPGLYVSMYDATKTPYDTLRLSDAADKRVAAALKDEDRVAMVEWFTLMEVDVTDLDITDTDTMLDMWTEHFDESAKPKGMTKARFNYFKRLNRSIQDLRSGDTIIIADANEEGVLEQTGKITTTDYVNVGQVANVKLLPLGTDNFGRDVLKELVSATGTSIVIGLIAGAVATIIGLTFGLLAGYLGGIADRIISEILNILKMIPTFFLIILAISLYGSSIDNMILIMALTGWAGTARLMRGQALAIREKAFIKNAEVLGIGKAQIILRHVIPNCIFPVLTNMAMSVSGAILSEAGLSFLGLGDSNAVSWGRIIAVGRRYLPSCWWICLFPGLAVILTSLIFHLLSDGLNQAINTRSRNG
jgi:peptide/nickel transport system permease protein